MGDPLSGSYVGGGVDPLAAEPEERKDTPRHTTVHANSTDPLARTQIAEQAQQRIKEQHAAGRLPPPSSVPHVYSDGTLRTKEAEKGYDVSHLMARKGDTLDSLKDLYAKGTIEIDELEARTAAVLAAQPQKT